VKSNFEVYLHIYYKAAMKDQVSPQNDSETMQAMALAAELRVVAGRLIRRLREQADDGDLTTSQTSVVLHLDQEGPATVTTLARAQHMRPQSMSAIVSALQLAGLVEGAPDPADGRQTLLSLTSACRDMIATGRAAKQDWLFRAIQTKLDREEQEQLASAVDLLKRLADF
jgi:DNA-binding MarR family transcriptional regulator